MLVLVMLLSAIFVGDELYVFVVSCVCAIVSLMLWHKNVEVYVSCEGKLYCIKKLYSLRSHLHEIID